ncbi:MAG: hypothetical protein ACK4GC_13190, partial [Paracoccaceae bacterium]
TVTDVRAKGAAAGVMGEFKRLKTLRGSSPEISSPPSPRVAIAATILWWTCMGLDPSARFTAVQPRLANKW